MILTIKKSQLDRAATMTELFFLTLASEFLAAIVATVYFYKYKDSLLWLLLPLLWYIPLNEVLCQFVFANTKIGFLLYNIYDIIVGPTILIITISQLKNKFRKKVIRTLLFTYLIAYCINLTQMNLLEELSTMMPTLSAIFIVIGLLYYLIELLKSDKIIQVGRDLFLWIAIGFLIFFIAYPVVFFAQKYLINKSTILKSLYNIHYIISLCSYLTIAFGLYYGGKHRVHTIHKKNYIKDTTS